MMKIILFVKNSKKRNAGVKMLFNRLGISQTLAAGLNHSNMEIKCLDEVDNDGLCSAWQKAFVDYGMSATKQQLLAMFKRRGYTPAISFGAFHEGELVSITLNGFGPYNGVISVYDTSTGTAPEHRRKGLAKRIFQKSLSTFAKHGAEQYILEVLKHNEAAVALYQGIGFSIEREFYYFCGPITKVNQAIRLKLHTLPEGYTIKSDITMPPAESIVDMWDFTPSWQNSIESIQRSIETMILMGVFHDDVLVGYGIFEPSTGDIPQIAVAHAHRRRGLGTHLLARLFACFMEVECGKVVNVETTCASLIGFLEEFGLPNAGGQYEMRLKLNA